MQPKRTRPGILLTVDYLCSRVRSPIVTDEKSLKKLSQYIRGTMKNGLEFKPRTGTRVHAWIDTSHNVNTDAKCQTGLILTLNGSPSLLIATRRLKQKAVVWSSYECELIGVYDKYPFS